MRLALPYAIAFLVALPLAAGIGAVTSIGAGNAVFLAGAAAIFVSIFYIRLGGPKALAGRTPEGRPILAIDPEKRKLELRKGIAIFLVGAGMWAVLLVRAWVSGEL